MGFLRKIRSVFYENWCGRCQIDMVTEHKKLYAMPDMTVGNYRSRRTPEYYRDHLVLVEDKSQIPAGMYACRMTASRCPECGYHKVRLELFLPVRDQEKREESFYFDKGELDSFIRKNSR